MFSVTDAETATIRDAYYQAGELSAAVELRRLFPGITDNARARECVRIIVDWRPSPLGSSPVSGQSHDSLFGRRHRPA